jgi:hypothetical protein
MLPPGTDITTVPVGGLAARDATSPRHLPRLAHTAAIPMRGPVWRRGESAVPTASPARAGPVWTMRLPPGRRGGCDLQMTAAALVRQFANDPACPAAWACQYREGLARFAQAWCPCAQHLVIQAQQASRP